jgi:hypothetical protein
MRTKMRTAVLGGLLLCAASPAFAGFFLSVNIAPPLLPVYAQPPIPGPGYIWTPGYWAYGDEGYFWVPGTWVLAPYAGALWTPGYWGWAGGVYVFHTGYWGPHIGYYGGINYGYGYVGHGYEGGYWEGGHFNYNHTVNNFGSVNITNTYNRTVVNNNVNVHNVSYNGGSGGVVAQPSATEQLAARDRHTAPIAAQQTHMQTASQNAELRASVNHGAPSIAATSRPGSFSGANVVHAAPASAAASASAVTAAGARPTAIATHSAASAGQAHALPAVQSNGTSKLASTTYAPHNGVSNVNGNAAATSSGVGSQPKYHSANVNASHQVNPTVGNRAVVNQGAVNQVHHDTAHAGPPHANVVQNPPHVQAVHAQPVHAPPANHAPPGHEGKEEKHQ